MPLSFGFGKSLILSKGQVATPSFVPPSESNLLIWYDAAFSGGSKDSSNAIVSVDNTSVATIVNRKSGGVNSTSPTAAQRPVWRSAANGINGKPAWKFDGAGDVMRTSSSVSMASFTVFAIFKISAGNLLYEHGTDNYLNMSNWYTISTKRTKNGAAVTSGKNHTGTWGNDNVAKVTTHTFDGTHATHKLSINGSNISLSNGTANDPGTATESNVWHIGGRGSGGTIGVNGLVGEILVYNTLLSASDITTIETYLKDKWGIS